MPCPRGDREIHGWELVFEDDFDSPELDTTKWFPFHLPHWSTSERAGAGYRIENGVLRLEIAPNQAPWCPERDGNHRVSNLQTGHWSGPPGSAEGQHRFKDGLLVRETIPARKLFVPRYCRLLMRARATLAPTSLAALWLIGFEDRPSRSGEITVMEVFGTGVRERDTAVGRGIKPIHDPKLESEFTDDPLPIRIGDWHLYELDWSPGGVTVFVGGVQVFRSAQSPEYPMQLMLNLYDLSGEDVPDPAREAWFDIDYVRAYTRRST